MTRVGIGYDVHRLKPGRDLMLGGVLIPHDQGLDGHSDADVLLHALCDAIFGALGEPDIGQFFPDTDPRWKNAPSHLFLKEAGQQIKLHRGSLNNADITVIAEQPKLNPHVTAMKEAIARCLEVEPDKISIKATTNERIGFIGRGEGMAAMAVVGISFSK
ncbi:MAG: 2-C-methyl-D-erythritol 2,4-cyclodiphosphate synthase [Verrucomicrobiota bacterium]|nr:2-C-methyl-D-erythritol 2,4-cyclodiphosphate synthase [Verrucomicrobiota bacterium]MDG1893153.1 2-C-methyl-D-erythritol 2,4-cyclodiphosphate synthase [Verrucomicrobiota bacterium]